MCGSGEGGEKVREVEESSCRSDARPVGGNLLATTSMESDEEDPMDGDLAVWEGLFVPITMGSEEDPSEEELLASGDWALVLGCGGRVGCCSKEGLVEDGASEGDELLSQGLCQVESNPARMSSVGEESEEEVCDSGDALAPLVCAWFIGGP